jgi:hypothetical protein
MPVQWKIDHQVRRVEATAEGVLIADDIRDYLARIAAEGAMPYAKLFDATAATKIALSTDELKSLGGSIRQYAIDGNGPIGPLAIVVAHSGDQLQAAHYADSAGSNRPLQIFRDKAKAIAWLAEAMRARTTSPNRR